MRKHKLEWRTESGAFYMEYFYLHSEMIERVRQILERDDIVEMQFE